MWKPVRIVSFNVLFFLKVFVLHDGQAFFLKCMLSFFVMFNTVCVAIDDKHLQFIHMSYLNVNKN